LERSPPPRKATQKRNKCGAGARGNKKRAHNTKAVKKSHPKGVGRGEVTKQEKRRSATLKMEKKKNTGPARGGGKRGGTNEVGAQQRTSRDLQVENAGPREASFLGGGLRKENGGGW